ncbi:MAG: DUF1080 domain-containing protein [Planctomycetes bacterium]|nr:DUF1080 domain-containing protein [Planctomycetota bacterium]
MKKYFLIIFVCMNFFIANGAFAQQGQKVTVAEILGERKEYYFDTDELFNMPAGFINAVAGAGKEGQWKVLKVQHSPSADNVVVQSKSDKTAQRFPLLIVDGADYEDAMAYVKFRAEGGEIDRAAGIVFRYKDNQNYYVLRANALENNVHLYKVVNGQQTMIGERNIKVSSNEWYLLKVIYDGKKIRCFFENTMIMEVSDDTFDSGSIGLWTKSDSYVLFDDFVIQENA